MEQVRKILQWEMRNTSFDKKRFQVFNRLLILTWENCGKP